MIKVVISTYETDKYESIEFSGHALFDIHGRDIVCSAVSILAINTFNSIEVFCSDSIAIELRDDGYLKATFDRNLTTDANLLIKSMILGLESLSAEYGSKFVTIIRQEV